MEKKKIMQALETLVDAILGAGGDAVESAMHAELEKPAPARGRGRPKKEEPKEEIEESAEDDDEESFDLDAEDEPEAEDEEPAEDEPTIEDVTKALSAYASRGKTPEQKAQSREKAKAILAKIGVRSVRDLQPKDFKKVIAACK